MDLASRSSFLQEKWGLATHTWRFGLTRHVWLMRKREKIKNSIERENLENSTIRKCSQSFLIISLLHEGFKFLFIGQGQVDIWHHLRGLPEASSSSNLKFNNKISFSHELEIKNSAATIIASWGILHECEKFSHVHAKSAWQFSFVCNTIPPFGSFHIVIRNENIWFLSFLL